MDPKQQTTSLDPKLKEAYERVMGIGATIQTPGTPVFGTSTPVQKADEPSVPISSPISSTFPSATPVPPVQTQFPPQPNTGGPLAQSMPQPAMPESFTRTVGGTITSHPQTPPQPGQVNPVSLATGAKSHAYVATKKGPKISPVIVVLAVIVFVLVYTLFWIKLFGVKVPFLP